MSVKIKFSDTSGEIDERYFPVPASKAMPKWFLDLPANISGFSDQVSRQMLGTPSAKRCVPLLDAFSSGYIIPTASDLLVTLVDGVYYYEWSNKPEIHFQIKEQLGDHKQVGPQYGNIPKLMLPWAIETPPGYSCLFIAPVNLDNRIIEAFSGVIDTDTFNMPGSFPFLLVDPNFTGLIPAGTPFIQVIPFKRTDFKMVIGDSKNGNDKSEKQHNKLRSVFRNGYRNLFWSKKRYN